MSKNKIIIVLVALAGGVLLGYQNCGRLDPQARTAAVYDICVSENPDNVNGQYECLQQNSIEVPTIETFKSCSIMCASEAQCLSQCASAQSLSDEQAL